MAKKYIAGPERPIGTNIIKASVSTAIEFWTRKIQNPSDIKELSKLIDRRHKDLSFWQLCLIKALGEIVRQLLLII